MKRVDWSVLCIVCGVDEMEGWLWVIVLYLYNKLGVGVCGLYWGGAQVKTVREMPRPCLEDIVQAQGNLPVSKSSLTKLGQ